jgi:peptide deformylase
MMAAAIRRVAERSAQRVTSAEVINPLGSIDFNSLWISIAHNLAPNRLPYFFRLSARSFLFSLIGMLLPIVQYDNPILRKKGLPHTFGNAAADAQLRKLSADMLETMHAAEGIGLAAQQIGLALQLCVIEIKGRDEEIDFDYLLDGQKPPLGLLMPLVLVNPTLKLDKSDENKYEEGCLSFAPASGEKLRADVKRPSRLVCRYQDIDGNPHLLECDGLLARCLQHEVDHLNGILFIDRLSKATLKRLWPKLEALKQEQRG